MSEETQPCPICDGDGEVLVREKESNHVIGVAPCPFCQPDKPDTVQ